MTSHILILDGHPDPSDDRFVHALANAYRQGAQSGKHEVLTIRLADLEFPLLRTQHDYEKGEPTDLIRECQDKFEWADHVVIFYPLWLGSMPAVLKGLLEQMLRPGFAFGALQLGRWPVKLHSGKSARIVVTTGMPGWLYRWYYRAHSVRSLQRNILGFVGFRRARVTIIGSVATMTNMKRSECLSSMRALGQAAH